MLDLAVPAHNGVQLTLPGLAWVRVRCSSFPKTCVLAPAPLLEASLLSLAWRIPRCGLFIILTVDVVPDRPIIYSEGEGGCAALIILGLLLHGVSPSASSAPPKADNISLEMESRSSSEMPHLLHHVVYWLDAHIPGAFEAESSLLLWLLFNLCYKDDCHIITCNKCIT